jgi:hypothetical protein
MTGIDHRVVDLALPLSFHTTRGASMSEDLTGEGVYETYFDPTEQQRVTKRVGTVKSVAYDQQAARFIVLVADEHGNLVTKFAPDVHLKRPPRAL